MIRLGMGAGFSDPTANASENNEKEVVIDNNIRNEWNNYIEWLKQKGFAGNKALDTNDMGGKMIDLYKRDFPNTPLSREMIIPIQKEFSKYRDWTLNQIKSGKARVALPQGSTLDDYMKDLSIIDGYAGSKTTSHKFPETYLRNFDNDTFGKTGYATTNK